MPRARRRGAPRRGSRPRRRRGWSYPRAASPARRPQATASAARDRARHLAGGEQAGDRASCRRRATRGAKASMAGSQSTPTPRARRRSGRGAGRLTLRDHVAGEGRSPSASRSDAHPGAAAGQRSRRRGPGRRRARRRRTGRARAAASGPAPRTATRRPGTTPCSASARASARPEWMPGRSLPSKVGGRRVPRRCRRRCGRRGRAACAAGSSETRRQTGDPPSRQRPVAVAPSATSPPAAATARRTSAGQEAGRGVGLEAGAEPAAGEAVALDEEDPPPGRGEDLGGGEPSRTGARGPARRRTPPRPARPARRRPARACRPKPASRRVKATSARFTGSGRVNMWCTSSPSGRERVDDAEQVVGRVGPGVLALDRQPVAAGRAAGAAVGLAVDAHQAGAAAARRGRRVRGGGGTWRCGRATRRPAARSAEATLSPDAGRHGVAVEGDGAVGREAGVLECAAWADGARRIAPVRRIGHGYERARGGHLPLRGRRGRRRAATRT